MPPTTSGSSATFRPARTQMEVRRPRTPFGVEAVVDVRVVYSSMVSDGRGRSVWIRLASRRRPASPLNPEATDPVFQ